MKHLTDTDELVAVAEGILGQRVTGEGFLGKGGVAGAGGGVGGRRAGWGGVDDEKQQQQRRRRRWGGGGEVVLVVSGEKGNLGRPERGGPPAVVT